LYRYEKIRDLEIRLNGEYETLKATSESPACDLKFVPEDIPDEAQENWLSTQKKWAVFWYYESNSTWAHRKILPLFLILIVWPSLFLLSIIDP
jgi:hypothetical protein